MFKLFFKSVFFIILINGVFLRGFSNSDEMLSFVKRCLPENPVILEAGGHYGEDTLRMKRVWNNSIIHVFEPLPSSCEKILKNTKNLENIFLHSYALSTYFGKTSFYLCPTNDGSSSINGPVDFNESAFEKIPIQVECTTIDIWAKERGLSHIDFMWLDMEGHELYALQNALSILSTVKAIYTEVDFVPVRQGSCLYNDLRAFLELNGFREVWKTSYGRFGDALFMRD